MRTFWQHFWVIVLLVPPTFAAEPFERPAACDTAYKTISMSDPVGEITFAFLEYCLAEKQSGLKLVKLLLKNVALNYDFEFNGRVFQKIDKTEIDLPEFFQIATDALDWGEKEKQKSAEELYKISLEIPEFVKTKELENTYRIPYLKLASKKGHTQAAEELANIREQQKQQIKSIRKSLDSAD